MNLNLVLVELKISNLINALASDSKYENCKWGFIWVCTARMSIGPKYDMQSNKSRHPVDV